MAYQVTNGAPAQRALTADETAKLKAHIAARQDLGPLAKTPFTKIQMTTAWANNLTHLLEYSSDGVTWTSQAITGTPTANAGTIAWQSFTTTISAVTARYWRYSAEDTGGTSQKLRIADLRFFV